MIGGIVRRDRAHDLKREACCPERLTKLCGSDEDNPRRRGGCAGAAADTSAADAAASMSAASEARMSAARAAGMSAATAAAMTTAAATAAMTTRCEPYASAQGRPAFIIENVERR